MGDKGYPDSKGETEDKDDATTYDYSTENCKMKAKASLTMGLNKPQPRWKKKIQTFGKNCPQREELPRVPRPWYIDDYGFGHVTVDRFIDEIIFEDIDFYNAYPKVGTDIEGESIEYGWSSPWADEFIQILFDKNNHIDSKGRKYIVGGTVIHIPFKKKEWIEEINVTDNELYEVELQAGSYISYTDGTTQNIAGLKNVETLQKPIRLVHLVVPQGTKVSEVQMKKYFKVKVGNLDEVEIANAEAQPANVKELGSLVSEDVHEGFIGTTPMTRQQINLLFDKAYWTGNVTIPAGQRMELYLKTPFPINHIKVMDDENVYLDTASEITIGVKLPSSGWISLTEQGQPAVVKDEITGISVLNKSEGNLAIAEIIAEVIQHVDATIGGDIDSGSLVREEYKEPETPTEEQKIWAQNIFQRDIEFFGEALFTKQSDDFYNISISAPNYRFEQLQSIIVQIRNSDGELVQINKIYQIIIYGRDDTGVLYSRDFRGIYYANPSTDPAGASVRFQPIEVSRVGLTLTDDNVKDLPDGEYTVQVYAHRSYFTKSEVRNRQNFPLATTEVGEATFDWIRYIISSEPDENLWWLMTKFDGEVPSPEETEYLCGCLRLLDDSTNYVFPAWSAGIRAYQGYNLGQMSQAGHYGFRGKQAYAYPPEAPAFWFFAVEGDPQQPIKLWLVQARLILGNYIVYERWEVPPVQEYMMRPNQLTVDKTGAVWFTAGKYNPSGNCDNVLVKFSGGSFTQITWGSSVSGFLGVCLDRYHSKIITYCSSDNDTTYDKVVCFDTSDNSYVYDSDIGTYETVTFPFIENIERGFGSFADYAYFVLIGQGRIIGVKISDGTITDNSAGATVPHVVATNPNDASYLWMCQRINYCDSSANKLFRASLQAGGGMTAPSTVNLSCPNARPNHFVYYGKSKYMITNYLWIPTGDVGIDGKILRRNASTPPNSGLLRYSLADYYFICCAEPREDYDTV